MNLKTTIIDVTEDKITDYPQIICFINPKHQLYHLKIDWIKEQYKNGLKIKLLFLENEKRAVGFIEYIPGEYCWRAIESKGYLFIHCIWTNGKRHQNQGLGSLLIQEAEKDARNMLGVVVMSSDLSFMATKDIFIKNNYKVVAQSGKDQLLVKQFKKGTLPAIHDWQSELKKYEGLNIVYSRQCPWVARFIEESKPVFEQYQLKPKIFEIKTPEEAQKAPSMYSVFNLIYDGKLLADRYISVTRLKNIIKKELNK